MLSLGEHSKWHKNLVKVEYQLGANENKNNIKCFIL
jgi:hypothetical protein